MASSMSSILLALLVALLCVSPARASLQASAQEFRSNPIRKVVTLLQSLQKKVEEEGAKEKELYEKFQCYCGTGKGDLAASISAAEAKAPAVGSEIVASEAKLEQAQADLKQAQAERAAAKQAIADATALREKEAAAFAAEKAEYDTNIAAIAKAVAALEKGAAGGFLQTNAAQVLRRAVAAGDSGLAEVDRQALESFLAQGSAYAPGGGEITGILKELGETMSRALAEATAAEQSAVKLYEEVVAAKTKESEAATETVEAKTQQVGELGVQIVQLKADLSDTEEALLEDKKYLAELDTSCATNVAEWEARSKTRAEELVALADTIKVLSDDDALELFKKTLPSASASFLQVQIGAKQMRSRALATVRAARQRAGMHDRAGLDLIALALTAGGRGSAAGQFDKVVELIDNLVSLLKKEQVDDEDKKAFCGTQLDQADDKKKALERAVSDAEQAIATTEEAIKAVTAEIAALEAGIKALDKSVASATEQRKEENAAYKDLMASDTAAKELLMFAKNRLNKFYNPKMYKAPPKVELSSGDRIYSSLGGEITTTTGGIAGTGIAVLAQVRAHTQRRDAPAPPPGTWGAYQTKSEDGNGVIAMMDLLITDLDKELVQAETEEKDAQADYEKLMADAADKRAADAKSLAEKSAAKADAETALQSHKESKAGSTQELLATAEYIHSIHGDCDWLLQYFDARKEARTEEIDSLTKAKAVLSGASYALLQTQTRGHLRGSVA